MDSSVVLLVESHDSHRQDLQSRLIQDGFEVIQTGEKSQALHFLRREPVPDLAIIEISHDDFREGLEIAEQMRLQNKVIPLILISRFSSEAFLIAALRAGVNDYFKRPFSYRDLLSSIKKILAPLPQQDKHSPQSTCRHVKEHDLIANNQAMLNIKQYLLKAAATDCNVLITGETGTGKERVAQMIHQHSPRRGKPMVCINCAALPDSLVESELFGYERGAFTGAYLAYPGKLRLAEAGTVFLDEIFEMSPYLQAKILRAIENKEFYRLGGKRNITLNIRILAASNQDLERSVEEGNFRKDLYFRLNVARIHLPPLRERQDDVPLLLEHYLQEMNLRFGRMVEGFTDEALELMLKYHWPGNIRELKNLVEAIFINLSSQRISRLDFPESFWRLREGQDLAQSEKERLLTALLTTNWNKSKAAQKLKWSRMTLYRKMGKYEISDKNSNEKRY